MPSTDDGKSHILHGVSLQVGRGEVVGLLGRNGVGKSTTLKSIIGLVAASQGDVFYEGRSIVRSPPHILARRGIAYVPEDRRIFRLLTVMENLRTGLDRDGVSDTQKKELLDKVFAYFPVLAERRNQAGGTLSGGEQQMLAIARAMMLEPKIILLDEPTEGLMPRMVSQISQIIDALHREGVAILLVEQNVPTIRELNQAHKGNEVNGNAARELHHQGHVVLDDENGEVLGDVGANQGHGLGRFRSTHPRSGFVQTEQSRLGGKRDPDFEVALLAVRKIGRKVIRFRQQPDGL